MKTMDHFTSLVLRFLSLVALVALFSSGAALKAQDMAFWTFERVDGPVSAVEKFALFSLQELDPEVRIKQTGRQLQVRIDRSFKEAVLLQKLLEGTGGPFRTMRTDTIRQSPPADAAIAGQVMSKNMNFDLAAKFATQPELLIQYGLPVLGVNAAVHEREAHHALVDNWLASHPHQQTIILQTLMSNEALE